MRHNNLSPQMNEVIDALEEAKQEFVAKTPAKYRCVACERTLTRVLGENGITCASCVHTPGWFNDKELKAVIDPGGLVDSLKLFMKVNANRMFGRFAHEQKTPSVDASKHGRLLGSKGKKAKSVAIRDKR
jgi:hypothetical protein